MDNAKVVVFCKHPHAPEIRFFLPGVFICGNEPSPFREPGNEKISAKRLAVTAVTCKHSKFCQYFSVALQSQFIVPDFHEFLFEF